MWWVMACETRFLAGSLDVEEAPTVAGVLEVALAQQAMALTRTKRRCLESQ
jgi:hypothetical protein